MRLFLQALKAQHGCLLKVVQVLVRLHLFTDLVKIGHVVTQNRTIVFGLFAIFF